MNYVFIGGGVVVLFIIYSLFAAKKNLKEAPQKLIDARKKFDDGDLNAALRDLGKAFVIPLNDHVNPEHKAHLIGVLDLLRQVFAGMNISGAKLIDPLYDKLSNSVNANVVLNEGNYKPLQDFFDETDTDAKLVKYLANSVFGGEISVAASASDRSSSPETSTRTTSYVNNAGKLIMRGKYQEAIDVYKDALNQQWDDTDKAFLHDQLGSCYLMNKDLANAEANYKESIATKSYFLNNWNYADFLVYHKRKDDAAIQLPKVEALVASPSDRKEFDKLQKNFNALK
ncbi:tetratricopeptide repeat protein [uncultured Flavobacterium sp.]|uniref:tetratricopeptide repeat protein n=1 Tax=uncultured Flavobacterium sp. TaxID=165435 RepID=UPI0025E9A963|nr:tetratricopeptide repeat protein [uncultured Flavobacterium sp.]